MSLSSLCIYKYDPGLSLTILLGSFAVLYHLKNAEYWHIKAIEWIKVIFRCLEGSRGHFEVVHRFRFACY